MWQDCFYPISRHILVKIFVTRKSGANCFINGNFPQKASKILFIKKISNFSSDTTLEFLLTLYPSYAKQEKGLIFLLQKFANEVETRFRSFGNSTSSKTGTFSASHFLSGISVYLIFKFTNFHGKPIFIIYTR